MLKNLQCAMCASRTKWILGNVQNNYRDIIHNGLRKSSGREFHAVGPATAKA